MDDASSPPATELNNGATTGEEKKPVPVATVASILVSSLAPPRRLLVYRVASGFLSVKLIPYWWRTPTRRARQSKEMATVLATLMAFSLVHSRLSRSISSITKWTTTSFSWCVTRRAMKFHVGVDKTHFSFTHNLKQLKHLTKNTTDLLRRLPNTPFLSVLDFWRPPLR